MLPSRRLQVFLFAGLVTLLVSTSALRAQIPLSRPGAVPVRGPGDLSSPYAGFLGSNMPLGLGYGPYSLSTVGSVPAVLNVPPPSYGSSFPYTMSTFPGYYPSFGYVSPGLGYGYGLQGMASLTQAQGQYWKDIQTARMGREQANQMRLDTRRKQLEYELWYETVRPTAPKMRDAERATDLDWARKDPPKTEIWSGRTLNVLLRSILASPTPTRGPTIPLDANIVKGLNLTCSSTRSNLALAKDEGKIEWTDALQEKPFDESRDRFSKNFEKAIKSANYGEAPERALVLELRDDLKRLDSKLEDMVRDLPPSRYIESRRLLNHLNDNIKGLSDSRVLKSCNQSWKKNVRTVSELVDHCMKNGLEFGAAAASGDEPAYIAAYYSIRSYEGGLVQTARR